jgi:hypothetical protein
MDFMFFCRKEIPIFNAPFDLEAAIAVCSGIRYSGPLKASADGGFEIA